METYIVRIYKRGDEDPDMVVGTVEEVGMSDGEIFLSFGELKEAINRVPIEEVT